MTTVTVFGASGYIGSNLIPELLKYGYTVRAVARNKEVLGLLYWYLLAPVHPLFSEV